MLLYSKEEDIKQYFLAIFALIHVHHSIRSSRRQETVSVPSVFNNKTGPLFLNSIDAMNFSFKKDSKDRDITTVARKGHYNIFFPLSYRAISLSYRAITLNYRAIISHFIAR